MLVRIARRDAFTLAELLVAISIIGVLIGLLLPAVQYSRETARRVTCQNNLKNQGLALHSFHDTYRRFPPGCDAVGGRDHAWCTFLLPYLEQGNVASGIDLAKRWNDPVANYPATRVILPIFRCPSSVYEGPGDTDYGGVQGSALTGATWGTAFRNGVLIPVSETDHSIITFASVTDGTSNTIFIGESADRDEVEHGLWADGLNIISHDNGGINVAQGEIFSLHRTGAFAVRVDGGTMFLSTSTDKYVVGALCTRNGGERMDMSSF